MTMNEKFCILMNIATKSLRVNDGSEAMELLLTSERVFVDLRLELDFPKLYKMNVILREWYDIKYGLQFRGFVYGKKLNALSQYDPYCYFDKLQNDVLQEKIKDTILKLFDKVKNRIPQQNYVIDFGVAFPEKKLEKCVGLIIELNSWSTSTGSGCFSWVDDIDLMTNGPFSFRVHKKIPITDYERLICPDWLELMKRALPKPEEIIPPEPQPQYNNKISVPNCAQS